MRELKPFNVDFSGINLVEASAGTGKTYNITSLYIRALIEKNFTVNDILVVTYTEAATKELKDRLMKRIRQSIRVLREGRNRETNDQFLNHLLEKVSEPAEAAQKLEEAILAFDEANIYTIHGFCYRSLQEQAFESRAMYDAEMIGDESDLLEETIADFWRKWVDNATENPLKRPLLKLLMEQGNDPGKLAGTFKSLIGKPYMKILPELASDKNLNEKLYRLNDLFKTLQKVWKEDRSKLFELLSRDEMSNYRSDWLRGWFTKMDELLDSSVACIAVFDKFTKFTQRYINKNLTKSAVKKGIEPPRHTFFELAEEYQDLANSLQIYEVTFKQELFKQLQVNLKKKKEQHQVLSYNDLLVQLQQVLSDGEHGIQLAHKLRKKYPVAFVDEFQDTDPCQYDIFRRIYQPAPEASALFMIGDPKQSIYGFRGADIFSYLQARQDAPDDKIFSLSHNYRSVPSLLKGINVIFSSHPAPFYFDQIKYKGARPGFDAADYNEIRENEDSRAALQFRIITDEPDEQLSKKEAVPKAVDDTANEIYRLLKGEKDGTIKLGGRPVEAKDIAVLVRKHNQADLIKDALKERGIKSVQYSQASVFKSEEASQLALLLNAISDSGNDSLIKTALALPLTKYSAEDLFNMEEDEQRWRQIFEQFLQWNKIWEEQGFAAMFRSVLSEGEIAEYIVGTLNGERKLTNILHLGELLQREVQENGGGMQKLLQWLQKKIAVDQKNTPDEEQQRLESDEELVKIVTIHRSKGMEYPIVFCPFLWHGPKIENSADPLVFHDKDDGQAFVDFSTKSDPDRAEKRVRAFEEELAEDLRLAYVAMTRACQRLYISWCYASSTEFSALAYLLQSKKAMQETVEKKINKESEAPDNKLFLDAISEWANDKPGIIEVQSLSDDRQNGEQLELSVGLDSSLTKPRTFTRSSSLEPAVGISSFSSLSNWMHESVDEPDYDQFISDETVERPESDKKTMFTFPRGPQPGTAIHNIFEDICFDSLKNMQVHVSEQLARQNIDPEWESVAADMIHEVVNISLLQNEPELKLSALSKDDLVTEMEFYFKIEEVDARSLLSIIREGREVPNTQGFAEHGYLKGFIDLIFKFEGKYYVLDYKTNHLGDTCGGYSPEFLQDEIFEALYDLQYHIYTIALHRFLNNKIADYCYETHFGGVFYLFLRGMNSGGKEGIFYDRPEYKVIKKLNNFFKTGNEK